MGEAARIWSQTESEVLDRLHSPPESGLSTGEAAARLRRHGPNVLKEEKRRPAGLKFLGQFNSPVVITLLVATLVSLWVGEVVDAIAIVSIVVLNAIVGFLQEGKAEQAVDALRKMAAPRARVVRDARVVEVEASGICPGDILVFEAGDYVPADARLLEANQLTVDEAVLTGESFPAAKSVSIVAPAAALADRTNMIFAGTAISTGSGRAIVTTTGMKTEIGQIAGLLEAGKAERTPLQLRLAEVSSKLLYFSGIVVLAVAALGFARRHGWLEVLMGSISLAVAAIPEGLPAVVTLALALAVRRMARRNAIIRRLPAVETLGSTDVICTDKTGTLTTGKMKAREAVLPDGRITSLQEAGLRENPAFTALVRSAVLCSNASLSAGGQFSGDPTEVALLQLALEAGLEPESIRKQSSRLKEWSFDSQRKRMSVAVSEGDRLVIHVKGAPESVFPLCHLSLEEAKKIADVAENLSGKGRRLLAVAAATPSSVPESAASAEKDLELLGLVSISDPPRTESIEAIASCQRAGIRVVMITGDHPATARAIATELGILQEGRFDGVLSGTELPGFSDSQLEEKVARTAVYARVAPEDKLRIVEAWKRRGSIVAMTGDGVNDAPALRAASIGISMGRGGTEVARQASSMILTDDNFATIVGAIEEGRGIYGNIRRTIQYLLSGNVAEILIMLGAALVGWAAPLAPIHLLWINLVTDGLPSLALAAEPLPENGLAESPKPSPRGFFDRRFTFEIVFIGLVNAVMALLVYGYSLQTTDELTARTRVFTFLVFEELFRSFASRSESRTALQVGPFSNVYHLIAVGVPIAFQLSLHHTPYFREVFRVGELSWAECGAMALLTLIPVTVIEVRKLLRRRVPG